MTSWLPQSYMGRKAVAKGVAGRRHELSEAKQGNYHYVYGPYAEPVLRIAPGDIVVAETKDAFEGKIKSETDSPTQAFADPLPQPAVRANRRRKAPRRATCSVSTSTRSSRAVRSRSGRPPLSPSSAALSRTNNTAAPQSAAA